MKGVFRILVVLCVCFAFSKAAFTAKWADDLSWTGFGYYEYLPNSYNPATSAKHPVIIHLQLKGNGQPGQVQRVLVHGIAKIINQNQWPASWDFIVINPQTDSWWDEWWTGRIVDYVLSAYPKADTTRIYLTGLSMGGAGVWRYTTQNVSFANKIAAIAPVCGVHGWSPAAVDVLVQSHMPVWAHHNTKDDTVDVWLSKNWIGYLNAAGISPQAKLSEYFTVNPNHDAWTRAYNVSATGGDNLYSWFLSHSRPNNAPATSAPTTKPTNKPTSSPCSSSSIGSGTGLRGVYYQGFDFNEALGVRIDPSINFAWVGGPGISNIPATNFSVRWTGNILAKQSGITTFYTQSNGGIRLKIGTSTVINQWNNHPTLVHSANFTLTKGNSYAITLEFFQREWTQSNVYLAWSHPCVPKETVPQGQLTPTSISMC